MIDEPLAPQVASRLRSLRQEIAKNQATKDEDLAEVQAEKTAFAEAPKFDEDDYPPLSLEDDAPTMWETPAFDPGFDPREATFDENRLGSAIPIVSDEPEHTERAPIPILEPIKPESDPLHPAEYTRREPIPMELFFETAEPSSVPMSSRPSKSSIVHPSSVVEHASVPVEEPLEQLETQEHTMLDVAAAMGIAPEMEPMQLSLDEDTFDEPKEPAKLPLPEEIPELDLSSFVEEKKQKKKAREGFGSDDIRRYAQAAETTSRLIPITLGVFVIVATLYAMVVLFHSTIQARDEHVELRFLATLNGAPTQLVTREGAKVARVYIETTPADLLVLHNREILGKTPLTVDLPIDLGEEIGIELSGPYYETWIAQVHKEALSEEYRIRAELTKK